VRSAFSRAVVALSLLAPCCGVLGCTSGADNPKMPDIPPAKIEPDTKVPPSPGTAKEPYGASKKYQDMMNK
jgi:hypothetical protein